MSNQVTVKDFMAKPVIQKKFEEILGQKSKGFVTSVLQIVSNNNLLANADPQSVLNSAMMGACLDLPINNNLGFAYIVPYNESYKDDQGNWQKKQVAQFQLGYKGLIQLAQRTGQYKAINAITVYENQFISYNHLTEELEADFTNEGSGEIKGFCAYFKLNNGFEKTVFWTKKQVEAHGLKFSKTFKNKNSVWESNFEGMAQKTVLKNALSKWGILSIEMQNAIVSDQSVIKNIEGQDGTIEDIQVEYVDNSTAKEENQMPNISDEDLEKTLTEYSIDQIKLQYTITDEQNKKFAK